MEQCGREMSRNQSESGIKYLVAAAHTTEKAMQPRNPFDEQFSFATRNKITRLVTSNVGSSSPLNTPSISLTEAAPFTTLDLTTSALPTPSLPFTSLIQPDSAFPDFLKTPKIIQAEPKGDAHDAPGHAPSKMDTESGRDSEGNSLQSSTSSSLTSSTGSGLLSVPGHSLRIPALSHMALSPVILAPNNGVFDAGAKSPKSNAVSVICPPKTAEIEADIVASLNLSNSSNSNTQHMNSQPAPVIDPLKSYLAGKPLFIVPNEGSNQSSHSASSHNSLPAMILNNTNKDLGPGLGPQGSIHSIHHSVHHQPTHALQAILPDPAQQSTSIITLTVPAPKRKNKKLTNGQSPAGGAGTGHRKEKTVEEMQKKIRDTEKALPPKAKPGRKSKGTVEDEGDQKERKKRSLERNRAAAMRCRLKKKKEVNSLKDRCDIYQEENQRLEALVLSLQDEVRNLKQKLLARDCSC